MRFGKKYKNFGELKFVTPKIPLRILKFQRPKWKKTQKKILSITSINQTFHNPLILKNIYKYWENIRTYYKQGLAIKKDLSLLFDKSNPLFYSKKNFSIKSQTTSFLVKPEFRIDVLLYRLNFFSSIYQARQIIQNGEILINEKKILGNYFVQKGDVISFNSEFQKHSFNLGQFSKRDRFSTFLEVDYYTKTIVILKNLDELSFEDFYLLIRESFDLRKLRFYML